MGKAKKVWSNLDYLTVSFDVSLPNAVTLPKNKGFETAESLGAFAHYQRVTRLDNGAVLFESDSPLQGAKIDMGGQCLQALRDADWGDLFQLGYWYRHEQRKRITRLDYAITLAGIGSPEQVLHEWDKGRVKTRIRSARNNNNRRANDGHTAQFGGDQADFIVKVYDKGSELPTLWEAYKLVTRVETKCTKPLADKQAKDMLEFGIDDAGCSWLKSKLDFTDLRWWQDALTCTKIPMEAVRTKEDKFWDYAATFLSWIEKRYERGESEEVENWFGKAYDLQQKIIAGL